MIVHALHEARYSDYKKSHNPIIIKINYKNFNNYIIISKTRNNIVTIMIISYI